MAGRNAQVGISNNLKVNHSGVHIIRVTLDIIKNLFIESVTYGF